MTVAFDIGANKGLFTDFFLKSGFDRVVAVEANPALAQALSEKYSSSSNVIVVNKAVSNSTGLINFWLCSDDGISSADPTWSTTGRFSADQSYRWTRIQVESITIDDLAQLHGFPNHIKMDIEGHEFAALQGMSLAYCPLRFEWEEEKFVELEKSLDYLTKIGYYFFGIVVEQGSGESMNFDQRPASYFDNGAELVTSLRKSCQTQHQLNKLVTREMFIADSPDGYEKFKLNDSRETLFWGMIWCFREFDAPKLKLIFK